jgi:hypothetical protein
MMPSSHQSPSSSSSRQTCKLSLPLSTPCAVQTADSGSRIPIYFPASDNRGSATGKRTDAVRAVDGDDGTSSDGGEVRPAARMALADGPHERRHRPPLEGVGGDIAVGLREPLVDGVDARRLDLVKSRPVSEMKHPATFFPKSSSHGCNLNGLDGELQAERRPILSSTNDSYRLPVSGYVVVGRGPHTMTAVAAAANGRHPPSTTGAPETTATVGGSATSCRDSTARNYDGTAGVLPLETNFQKQQQQPDHRSETNSAGVCGINRHCSKGVAAGPADARRQCPHPIRDSAADYQPMPLLRPSRTADYLVGRDDGAPTAALGDHPSSRQNAPRSAQHCSRSNGAPSPSRLSHESLRTAVGLRDSRSDHAAGGPLNDANRQRDLNDRSGPSRNPGPILATSTVCGRPTSCIVDGRNFNEISTASNGGCLVPPPRPDLPTFVTGWQVLPNGCSSSGGGSTVSVPMRCWSYSDDSGFCDDRTTSHGDTAAVKLAPSLEAHSSCLSYSPPSHAAASAVDSAQVSVGGLRRGPLTASSASSSSSASSGSGLQIRRRLKTIVESLDGFASGSNRKSVLSVATNGSGNTPRSKLRMQRSSSEPEGIDRVGKNANNDGDDEFGFRCDAGYHQVKVLRDGCQLGRCTGNKLPPTPAAVMANGVDSAGDATSNKTSSGNKPSKPTMSIKLIWPSKKAASPGGGGRHSEPCSPLNSSATSRSVSESVVRYLLISHRQQVNCRTLMCGIESPQLGYMKTYISIIICLIHAIF